jgi:hypothetical protein
LGLFSGDAAHGLVKLRLGGGADAVRFGLGDELVHPASLDRLSEREGH